MKRLIGSVVTIMFALSAVVAVPGVVEAGRKGKDATATTGAAAEASTNASTSMKYLVGLGDSRGAGGGLPAHGSDGPSQYDAACERSPYASIAYLASATDTPVVNYACVGATTDDLYSSGRFNRTRVPAQIKQVDEFVLTDPGTVFVVQTGANDMKWSTVLARCAKATCGEKKRDNAALKVMLKRYERRLDKAIKTLRKKGAEGQIVLTGTYSPIPSDRQLLEQYGISDTERVWIETAIDQLNERTADIAARHDNVQYVALELRDDQLQTIDDPMPFHPTISGQQSIARQLQDAIESRR